MPFNGWVTKYACYVCKKNHSTNEQAMLVCASCMKAWHSCTLVSSSVFRPQGLPTHHGSEVACHIPPVTQSELTRMWEAETDKTVPLHIRRLSTWRCMRCSLPFSVQSKCNMVVSARTTPPLHSRLNTARYPRTSLPTRMNSRKTNRRANA